MRPRRPAPTLTVFLAGTLVFWQTATAIIAHLSLIETALSQESLSLEAFEADPGISLRFGERARRIHILADEPVLVSAGKSLFSEGLDGTRRLVELTTAGRATAFTSSTARVFRVLREILGVRRKRGGPWFPQWNDAGDLAELFRALADLLQDEASDSQVEFVSTLWALIERFPDLPLEDIVMLAADELSLSPKAVRERQERLRALLKRNLSSDSDQDAGGASTYP